MSISHSSNTSALLASSRLPETGSALQGGGSYSLQLSKEPIEKKASGPLWVPRLETFRGCAFRMQERALNRLFLGGSPRRFF